MNISVDKQSLSAMLAPIYYTVVAFNVNTRTYTYTNSSQARYRGLVWHWGVIPL